MPHIDDPGLTPKGGHEGGKPKNFRYMVGGIILIFIIAMVIMGSSTAIFHRPGADPGATEKAPAD